MFIFPLRTSCGCILPKGLTNKSTLYGPEYFPRVWSHIPSIAIHHTDIDHYEGRYSTLHIPRFGASDPLGWTRCERGFCRKVFCTFRLGIERSSEVLADRSRVSDPSAICRLLATTPQMPKVPNVRLYDWNTCVL